MTRFDNSPRSRHAHDAHLADLADRARHNMNALLVVLLRADLDAMTCDEAYNTLRVLRWMAEQIRDTGTVEETE